MSRKNYFETIIGVVAMLALLAVAVVSFAPTAVGAAPEFVRERISIDAREDVWISGADIILWDNNVNSNQTAVLSGADGSAQFDGALNVDGAADFDSTANFDGATTFNTTVTLPVGTEMIGVQTVITVPVAFTTNYTATGGTGTVATIADGEIWFVHSVFINVTDDFDATGDDALLVIGDGNDPNGFLNAADAALQTSFTEATGYTAGWYGLESGSGGAYTLDDGGPFVYAPSGSAETIDWAVSSTGDDLSAGDATIYVIYTRIQ